jgi:hypothetical protein
MSSDGPGALPGSGYASYARVAHSLKMASTIKQIDRMRRTRLGDSELSPSEREHEQNLLANYFQELGLGRLVDLTA